MSRLLLVSTCFVAAIATLGPAGKASAAITITIDYSLDSQGFFADSNRRDALQAAASRFERVLAPSSLAAVGPNGTNSGTSAGWRIGFTHPGTGASHSFSTAADQSTDPFRNASNFTPASQYGFGGLNENQWILFAGGRNNLGSDGVGGTGFGANFTSTFNDLNGPMHRGLIANTPSNTTNDLPAWGGSISFNASTAWHFDVDTVASGLDSDFYTVALHEIGHALGLASRWNQITKDQVGDTYSGEETLAAYNADNGTNLLSLDFVSETDRHFADNTYHSEIFAEGSPNLVGTVGLGTPQDLLLEPITNFSNSVHRLELTNTDVAQLRDIGWATATSVPEPSSLAVLFIITGMLIRRHRRLPENDKN